MGFHPLVAASRTLAVGFGRVFNGISAAASSDKHRVGSHGGQTGKHEEKGED